MTVNPLSRFWSGQSVLLTGHTGFKGSWLALWLELLGAKVTGLALPAQTQPNLFELLQPYSNLVSELGDIRDEQLVARVIEFGAADDCHPYGRPVACAPLLPQSSRDIRHECDGYCLCLECSAAGFGAQGRARYYDRQGLSQSRYRAGRFRRTIRWAVRIPIRVQRPERRWWSAAGRTASFMNLVFQ